MIVTSVTPAWWETLTATTRGQLKSQVSLAAYSTWGVGGIANWVFRPADEADLGLLLKNLPTSVPVYWLGLGSNTLICDEGIQGMIILPLGRLNTLMQVKENQVTIGAGVACAQAARFCARLGLSGTEFLAGIPGTMGGALRMNAGCFGGQTWDNIIHVNTIDRQGNSYQREPTDFEINYREVIAQYPQEWFTGGTFRLIPKPAEACFATIRELLNHRAMTQPTGQATCGSVFKNPPGNWAAQLIEAAGLKGLQVGGAVVSMKHANFIVNEGEATAADIEQLIMLVQQKVEQYSGIKLQKEVHCLGEDKKVFNLV